MHQRQKAWESASSVSRNDLRIFYVSVLIVCVIIDTYPNTANYIAANPGPIIDYHTRREIGTHTGLWKYTIGQRAKLKNMLERMVVAKKDVMTNALYVTPAS